MSDTFAAPQGSPGALSSHGDGLGHAAADVLTHKTAAQKAAATAIENWEGPRKDAFVHAAAGIQAELQMLQGSTNRVATLVKEYATALRSVQDEVSGYATSVHQAESRADSSTGDGPDVQAQQHVGMLRSSLAQDAEQAKRQLAALAGRIAAEIDAETDTLVPNSQGLSPAEIARRIDAQFEITGIRGAAISGTLSSSDAWKVLKPAEEAVPDQAVEGDGEVNWKEFADYLNVHGPAQVLAGTVGPLSGADGWAITRYFQNQQAVKTLDAAVNSLGRTIVGPSADAFSAGKAPISDVDAALDEFNTIKALEKSLAGNPEAATSELLAKVKAGGIPETGFLGAVGKGLGLLGVASDVLTIINPGADIKNPVERDTLRGAAAANIVATGMAFAPSLAGLVGVNAVADWIPGVGQVVMLGTGLFLAGDWLAHQQWFRTGLKDTGHAIASGAKHVWNGVKDIGSGIKNLCSDIF